MQRGAPQLGKGGWKGCGAHPLLRRCHAHLRSVCAAPVQVRPEDIYALLCRQTVDLVFTAHPTQVGIRADDTAVAHTHLLTPDDVS